MHVLHGVDKLLISSYQSQTHCAPCVIDVAFQPKGWSRSGFHSLHKRTDGRGKADVIYNYFIPISQPEFCSINISTGWTKIVSHYRITS